MRLIDGTLLNEMLSRQKHYANDNGWHRKYIQGICDAQRELRLMPTIEAEPVKHGKWIQRGTTNIYSCSECKFEQIFYGVKLPNYCNVCGADMRCEREEDATD